MIYRVDYFLLHLSEGVHHLYKELDVQVQLFTKALRGKLLPNFPTACYCVTTSVTTCYSVTTSVTTCYRDHLRYVCIYSLSSCCNHHNFQWHQTIYCDYLRHVDSCSLPSSCKSSTLQWQTISGIRPLHIQRASWSRTSHGLNFSCKRD